MKLIHVLRTSITASDCRPLFKAAAALGVRVGWLDLESTAAVPPELEEAAAQGAFRAVGVSAARVLTVKPVKGASVLKDLLREHFVGCRLVVIRGDLDAPELLGAPGGYRVRFEDGAEKDFSAEALAKALRKPRLRESSGSDASAQTPE